MSTLAEMHKRIEQREQLANFAEAVLVIINDPDYPAWRDDPFARIVSCAKAWKVKGRD